MKLVPCLFLTVQCLAATTDNLYGTWRLVSARSTLVDTGEQTALFGDQPKGVLQYTRDGRVTVLVVAGPRLNPADLAKVTDAERAELFKTMAAYSGTFTFDGMTVVHTLDLSWNETWTGTRQVRRARLDGGRLHLASIPQPRALDGRVAVNELIWEKLE